MEKPKPINNIVSLLDMMSAECSSNVTVDLYYQYLRLEGLFLIKLGCMMCLAVEIWHFLNYTDWPGGGTITSN
jgi:hypothetical protein